jgi:hypothetical protein
MDEATLQEKENTANELRTKIANGDMSFEKAVAEFSEDNASKVNGGKISIQEGSLVEEPEIWEALGKLKNDDIASVIKTKKGYSIVKVNNIVRNKERYNRPESAKILKIGLQAPEGATEEENSKLRADFLKKEYGIGGESITYKYEDENHFIDQSTHNSNLLEVKLNDNRSIKVPWFKVEYFTVDNVENGLFQKVLLLMELRFLVSYGI